MLHMEDPKMKIILTSNTTSSISRSQINWQPDKPRTQKIIIHKKRPKKKQKNIHQKKKKETKEK